jgi:hypothetical protein
MLIKELSSFLVIFCTNDCNHSTFVLLCFEPCHYLQSSLSTCLGRWRNSRPQKHFLAFPWRRHFLAALRAASFIHWGGDCICPLLIIFLIGPPSLVPTQVQRPWYIPMHCILLSWRLIPWRCSRFSAFLRVTLCSFFLDTPHVDGGRAWICCS